MQKNGHAAENSRRIEEMTSQTVEMVAMAQKAVENLAEERMRQKMSAQRFAAIAKELKQLQIILNGYEYRHSADSM